MTIQDAMLKTGLTRKAIYYYEKKGLIDISYDTNGYRLFNEEDLKSLHLISFLSKMRFSIQEMYDYFHKKIDINELFENKLNEFENEVKHLEKLKTNINKIKITINGNNDKSIIENILIAENSITPIYEKRKDYIENELKRVFPGKIGIGYSIVFKEFVNNTLKDEKEKNAFKNIINLLDNSPEIIFPKKIRKYLEDILNDDQKMNVGIFDKYDKTYEEFLKEIKANIPNVDKKTRKEQMKRNRKWMKMWKYMILKHRKFLEDLFSNLYIISRKFKNFKEYNERLRKEKPKLIKALV